MDWKKLGKDALASTKQFAEEGKDKFDDWKDDPERLEKIAQNKEKKAAVKETNKNKAGLFYQGVYCPKCRSTDVQFMQNNRKGFSVGKAVGGGLLTGGVGTLAGFAGKKGKNNQWRCNDCGRTFKSKK